MVTREWIKSKYPVIKRFVEAQKPLVIDVIAQDSVGAIPKDVSECVMARACKRQYRAIGAVVCRSVAWLIFPNGDAVRYSIPPSVKEETTVFDRFGGGSKIAFEPGRYQLSVPTPPHRQTSTSTNKKRGSHQSVRHATINVR